MVKKMRLSFSSAEKGTKQNRVKIDFYAICPAKRSRCQKGCYAIAFHQGHPPLKDRVVSTAHHWKKICCHKANFEWVFPKEANTPKGVPLPGGCGKGAVR
eukprot:EG_transcript_44815